MENFFETFNLSPRPWLEEDALKQRFLALSSEKHPDRMPGQAPQANAEFAKINQAHQVLRQPKDRLGHLLELITSEKVAASVQSVPDDIMSLFAEANSLVKGAERFLAEQAGLASPMLKAASYPKALDWIDQLQAFEAKLHQQRTLLDQNLKAFDLNWNPAAPDQIGILRQLQLRYSYLTRWQSQIQEKLAQLAL